MSLFRIILPVTLVLAVAACKTPEERANEFLENGLRLVAEGDLDRAAIEFRNALKTDKTAIDARRELARINLAYGNTRDGFRNYLRVVEQNPDDADAQLVLSELSFDDRNWDSFDRHAPEAVRLNPDLPRALAIDLAYRYRQAALDDDMDARRTVLREAEALKADLPDSTILRTVRTNGYVDTGRLDDALSELEEAIASDPENIDVYNARLQLLARQNNLVAVEEELRRMARIFPEEESVKGDLLRLLMAQDKEDDAEAYLRQLADAEDAGETDAVALIQFLLRRVSAEEALAELDRRIAGEASAYLLRTLRASLLFDTGERTTAVSQLEEMIAQGDAMPVDQRQNARVILATMLVRDGNEVGARRLVEEVLTEDASSVGALKLQARWMIEDDNTDGAITAMRTALAEAREDTEAMTIMADAYSRAGQPELMLDFLALAADTSNNAPEESLRYAQALMSQERFDQAETTLIAALRLSPGNVPLLNTLGRIYLQKDDLPRLRQTIDTLKRYEDGQTTAASLEVELLAREGGGEDVLSYLQTLSEANSENDGIRLAIIRTHLQNGEVEKAVSLSDELAAANPDNLSYAYFNGLTKASAGQYDAALDIFERLTELRPAVPDPWLQLARMQVATGGVPGAQMAVIDRGLEATDEASDLLWAKASLLQSQDDIDGAIGIYEKLYERNSASLIVANNLASLLSTYKSDDESLQRARIISRRLRGTDVPAFQDTYGWIQYRLGNHEEALEYLEPAAAALSDDASVQYHLGMTLNTLGRSEDAAEALRRAVGVLGPGAQALEGEIRARLAEIESALQQ